TLQLTRSRIPFARWLAARSRCDQAAPSRTLRKLRRRRPGRRQCKLKRAARLGIPGRPYPAAVLLYNGPADRQTDPHSARLGREERGEQLVHFVRLDSDAGVLDRDEYLTGPILTRPYAQLMRTVRHRTRGLDAVHQEIHDDLLQLDPITKDLRQCGCKFSPNRDAPRE